VTSGIYSTRTGVGASLGGRHLKAGVFALRACITILNIVGLAISSAAGTNAPPYTRAWCWLAPWRTSSRTPGTIIGEALEQLNHGNDLIRILVTMR